MTSSVETRFKSAIASARSQGVRVRQNVMSCCRSCAQFTGDTSQFVWTFGGQGGAVQFVNGTPYYRAEVTKAKKMYGFRQEHAMQKAMVSSVFFNHTSTEAAQKLADALKAEGFTVEWDGTKNKCVVVKF